MAATRFPVTRIVKRGFSHLGVACLKLTGRLPLSLNRGLGYLMGWVLLLLARDRVRIVDTNLALCFPECSRQQRRRLRNRNILESGIWLTETARAHTPDIPLPPVVYKGEEHFEAARASGRGVLLCGAHFLCLDMAGRLIGSRWPIGALYRANPNPVMDDYIRAGRFFNRPLIERKAIRQLVRELKQGAVIWYAPDQDYGIRNSVFAPLFGVNAATVTATTKIVRLSNCVVMPVLYYRKGEHYCVEFFPPLENFGQDEQQDATRFNEWLEHAIRQVPEQYLWSHKRFKTRPPGEEKVYR